MMQVVGPIKQTRKQKEYCKQLGIEDINKVEITWGTYSICPHCNKVIYHEEKNVIPRDSGEPEISSDGGWA